MALNGIQREGYLGEIEAELRQVYEGFDRLTFDVMGGAVQVFVWSEG